MSQSPPLQRQVKPPVHQRPWLFLFACLTSSMLGASLAVLHSLHSEPPPISAALPAVPSALPDCVDKVCPSRSVHSILPIAELQRWLDMDAESLGRSARIVPSMRNGRSNGFKLYAIRAGSIWKRIGLANGDTLHKVQGMDISSPEQSLELYARLAKDPPDELTIELSREDCPVTVVVTLVPAEDEGP